MRTVLNQKLSCLLMGSLAFLFLYVVADLCWLTSYNII